MNMAVSTPATRKRIAIRLLYTLFFMIVLGILKSVLMLTVVFQFIYLFIAQKYSRPLRSFTNRVITYTYRVMRYVSFNENNLPFPFGDFPQDLDPPVDPVVFS